MRYILCLLFLIFGSPSFADVSAEDLKKYGPVDMALILQNAIEDVRLSGETAPVTNEIPKPNNIIIKAFSNERWLLTRTVFFGASNIEGAIAIMSSPKTLSTITKKGEETTKEALAMLRGDGDTEPEETSTDPSGLIEFYDYTEATLIKDFVADFVGTFNKIEKIPGLKGDLTMYKITSTIGCVLLVLFFMIRLTWDIGFFVVGDNQTDTTILDGIYLSFKFMFLYLAIVYLSSIVFFGLSFSDKITALIFKTVPGDINQIVSNLLQVKMVIADVTGTSVWDAASSGAGSFLAKFFGWLSYYLASFTVFILILMADVLLSLSILLAPICFAFSLLPNMDNFLTGWIKGYITSLLWVPLSAMYVIMLLAIMSIGIDTSISTFMVISIAYIMGAMKLPQMAQNMSGVVLASVATSIAAYPIAATQLGGRAAGSMGKGAYNIVKKMKNKN